MTVQLSTISKYFTGAALAIPFLLGSVQPAHGATEVFGNRNGGGANADIARLTPLATSGDWIVAACVDGWADSARCSYDARRQIANRFCEIKGYENASGWYYRRNARRQHHAFVLNMSYNNFFTRVATGHPLFFTEITCQD